MRKFFSMFACVTTFAAVASAQQAVGPPNALPPNIARPGTAPIYPPTAPSKPPADLKPDSPAKPKDNLPVAIPDFPLPHAEVTVPLGHIDVRNVRGNWQVWNGTQVFAELGNDWKSAEQIATTLKALRRLDNEDILPTDWVNLGVARPVVGYALVRGQPGRKIKGMMAQAITIDLKSVRAEQVRGVWVVRDDWQIHLNFDKERIEAQQTVAVLHRYGLNRLGHIGNAANPAFRYLFAGPVPPDEARAPAVPTALQAQAQEEQLDRAGLELPGIGIVGQKIHIDHRKLEVRREKADYVLAHGTEILSRFGMNEWAARDAQRALQDMRPNAIVRIGKPGITFFLSGSEAPKRLPFGTFGAPFEPERLTVRELHDGKAQLVDPFGQVVATGTNRKEIEQIKAAIVHFKLNRTCQIGSGAGTSLSFLGRAN